MFQFLIGLQCQTSTKTIVSGKHIDVKSQLDLAILSKYHRTSYYHP